MKTVDVGHVLDEGRWTGYQKLLIFGTALTIVLDGVDNQLLPNAVPFIAPDEVNADDIVVDLRGVDEAPQPFAGGRRLDVDHVVALAAEPSPKGRIVLCCRSGQRALLAADRLRERGLAKLALVALG